MRDGIEKEFRMAIRKLIGAGKEKGYPTDTRLMT
jgi:hypothetical protein